MQDLNTLVHPGTGWTLNDARAINSHGQIAGFGSFEGQTRAFRLDPIDAPYVVPEINGNGFAAIAFILGAFGLGLYSGGAGGMPGGRAERMAA